MKRPDPQRALALGAGLVIVGLTAAAFWLSYSHLAGVASANGLQSSPVRAWAWPACLDLFIVAGELLWLRASLMKRFDWWAFGLTTSGSFGSIALNVAGVGTSAPALAYIVAAVPPTAALLAFGALMKQVHQALSEPAEPISVDVIHTDRLADLERVLVPEVQPAAYPQLPAAVPEAVPAGVRLLPIVARPEIEVTAEPVIPVPVLLPAPVTVMAAAEQARTVVTEPVGEVVTEMTTAEQLRAARRLNRESVKENGRPVTIERLREELSLSRRDATALRREIVRKTVTS